MELKYIVKNTDIYENVNQILTNEFNLSTRLRNKLIKSHNIFKNYCVIDTRDSVKANDIICIDLDYKEDNSNIVPTKMDLDIIYEDEWILVVNKPPKIPVHPSRLHFDNSLSNGVKFYFDSIGLNKKIRPVNRLDLNTSGLVIFAKCEYIQEQLSKQMVNDEFKKEYICLVSGHLENKNGIIDLPIARKKGSIIEREIDKSGKRAITKYQVLKEFEKYSEVQCYLETGRTHQIRVHFSSIGHPLLGDTLYGSASCLINRQALHSYTVSFIHPIYKKHLLFKANIPKDISSLL